MWEDRKLQPTDRECTLSRFSLFFTLYCLSVLSIQKNKNEEMRRFHIAVYESVICEQRKSENTTEERSLFVRFSWQLLHQY